MRAASSRTEVIPFEALSECLPLDIRHHIEKSVRLPESCGDAMTQLLIV
jgi:hypothetical protein